MTTHSETLTDRLAHGMIELIDREGLRPGDSLPTVRELASRFEVTPPTIREALRQLQATGSITMRHGSGIYVGEGIDRLLLPNPNGTRLTDARVVALIEARLTIEPGIAALAAANRTEEQLTMLSEAARNAASHPDAAVVRNFHREMARATGNPMLYEVMDSMLFVHSTEQRRLRRMIEDRSREHRRHSEILAAIEDEDAASARALTEQHLEEILREAQAKH